MVRDRAACQDVLRRTIGLCDHQVSCLFVAANEGDLSPIGRECDRRIDIVQQPTLVTTEFGNAEQSSSPSMTFQVIKVSSIRREGKTAVTLSGDWRHAQIAARRSFEDVNGLLAVL